MATPPVDKIKASELGARLQQCLGTVPRLLLVGLYAEPASSGKLAYAVALRCDTLHFGRALVEVDDLGVLLEIIRKATGCRALNLEWLEDQEIEAMLMRGQPVALRIREHRLLGTGPEDVEGLTFA